MKYLEEHLSETAVVLGIISVVSSFSAIAVLSNRCANLC
jgi:hypothetical protein